MKILNAIHAQFIGGVEQVFRDYADALLESGHDVALAVSDNGGSKYDEYENVFKLKNYNQILDIFHFLFIIIKFKPDFIICHTFRPIKWMRFLKYFTKAKVIGVNHGVTYRHSLQCDGVISVNEDIANNVVKAGFNKENNFIVANSIKITQKYHKKSIKKLPIIAMYGRIEEGKGFDILIRACEILAKKHDFRLKIGGFEIIDSNYKLEKVEKLTKKYNIHDKFQFVGTVLDKKQFFEDVDIFVVPSRHESFGMVILEGFLNSTLVISSDTDGGKLLIDDEKDGILFKNEDFADLATKIEKSLNMHEKYGIITKEAYEKIEENYSLEILSKKLNVILQKI